MGDAVSIVSLRMVRQDGPKIMSSTALSDSGNLYELFRGLLQDYDREAFWVACVDVKLKPTCLSLISVGSLQHAGAHPREVFKVALMANAYAIFTAHNHPSGDPTPSYDDRLLTDKLQRAGCLMGIPLLDHLIIGDNTYYSFADDDKL